MKQVKKWTRSSFGLFTNYGKEMPSNADVVILCELTKSGLQPVSEYIGVIPHKRHKLKSEECDQ